MSRHIQTGNRIALTEDPQLSRQGGRLLFTRFRGQECALLISGDRLRAAQFFPEGRSEVGAIYIAKVKSAVRHLNAFFVEIGGEGHPICFLSGKDAAHPYLLNRSWDGRILEGDEFPVQVVRDGRGAKQPSVTTLISLSNSCFALSVGSAHTGFSSRLDPEQKKQLREILQRQDWSGNADFPVPAGLIVRTRAAELIPREEMLLEMRENLTREFAALFAAAAHRTCFSCLKSAPLFWEDALEHLASPGEYVEILTDSRELYEQLQHSVHVPGDKEIRLYSEEDQALLPLAKLYNLDGKLQEALGRRVWLKSGGYLIIDPTEALTVIDVNSGRYEKNGGTPEETYRRVNREAAEEIVRQLRLRNLSGIILVDFINMKSERDREELLQYMTGLAASDRQRTTVVDMTPLGLVEITRKKGSRPLAEQLEAKPERKPREI